jgi:hypothetical protein
MWRQVATWMIAAAVLVVAFVMYSFTRTASGPLDGGIGHVLGCVFSTGWCGVMPVLLVGIPVELVVVGARSGRTRRRVAAGLCGRCSYPRGAGGNGGRGQSTACPECGLPYGDRERPRPWMLSGRVFLALTLALLTGCLAAEAIIQSDERAFRREVAQRQPTAVYRRNRVWPRAAELIFDPERGFWTVDD